MAALQVLASKKMRRMEVRGRNETEIEGEGERRRRHGFEEVGRIWGIVEWRCYGGRVF